MAIRGSDVSTASSGTSALPRPAPAIAWTVPLSSERNTKLGSVPAARSWLSTQRVLRQERNPMSFWSPMIASDGTSSVAGQRGRRGDDEHERVRQELDAVERALGQRQDAEREVEPAGLHHVHQALVAVGLHELDLDARPDLAEAADDGGQDPRADALVDADPEPPGLPRRVREQVRACGLEAVGDRLDVAQQERAGLGELHRPPAAAAVEQAHAERRLEAHHVLADGRLRVVKGIGGAVERALVRDGPEAEQLPEAEVRERVREDPAARRRGDGVISCHDFL